MACAQTIRRAVRASGSRPPPITHEDSRRARAAKVVLELGDADEAPYCSLLYFSCSPSLQTRVRCANTFEGMLLTEEKGAFTTSFKPYFYTLRGDRLLQYTRRSDETPRGQIDVTAPGFYCRSVAAVDGRSCFELGDKTTQLVLAAETKTIAQQWLQLLRPQLDVVTGNLPAPSPLHEDHAWMAVSMMLTPETIQASTENRQLCSYQTLCSQPLEAISGLRRAAGPAALMLTLEFDPEQTEDQRPWLLLFKTRHAQFEFIARLNTLWKDLYAVGGVVILVPV